MSPKKPTGVDLRRGADGTTSYRIRWRLPTGGWGSHTFAKRVDAIDALRAVQAGGGVCHCPKHTPESTGTPLTPGRPKTLTFGAFATEHAAALTGVGEGYRQQFLNDLRRHFGGFLELPIGEVTPMRVRRWIVAKEQAGLSPTTIRRLLKQAGAAMRAAVDAGHATRNPFTGHRLHQRAVDKGEDMVFLTHAEWNTLRDALPAGVYRDLCTVLVGTGLRFGEVTALRVADVELGAVPPRLHVRQAWKADGHSGYLIGPPKSARSRRAVTFSSAVAAALEPHVAGRAGDELVFLTPATSATHAHRQGGTPIRHSNFYHRVWAPAVTAAGLGRRPRVHDLRHSHASWLIAEGRPVSAISRRLGHQSITTTVDRYGHILPSVDVEDVAALERLMPSGEPSDRPDPQPDE